MGGTRFRDARAGTAGEDGPVSGALVVIPISIDLGTQSEDREYTLDFPAGMSFKISSINVQVLGAAGDPKIQVGSAVGGAERVASATVADGDLTIISGQDVVAAGGIISVTITNDATADAFDSALVTTYGYITSPPTSLPSPR